MREVNQITSFKRLVEMIERSEIPEDGTINRRVEALIGGANAILEISGCKTDPEDIPRLACPEYVERFVKVKKEHGYA